VAATEDFGIVSVEANAAGKPVVAFAAGGALETIEEGVTGTFFSRHDPDDVLAAIKRCDRIETPPETVAAAARRFSRTAFERGLLGVLDAGWRAHRERLRGGARQPA
jgi:glycosyltransferase involved in cell wall biosynthesis